MSEIFEAETIAWDALRRAQPAGKIPSWIFLNVTKETTPLKLGRWKFQMYLFLKRTLRPGEYWQMMENGTKILREIDPITGENSIVIHYGDEGRVPLFKVDVDLVSKKAFVVSSTDITILDRSKFELLNDDAIARERLRHRLDPQSYAFVFGGDG